MRSKGQSFELEIQGNRADIVAEFHRAHRARYGYAQSNVVEVVSARVRSTGIVEKPAQQRDRVGNKQGYAKPAKHASAYLDEKQVQVGVYDRQELLAGTRLRTPCIVTEYSSTTLIPSEASAELDGYGNLIIQVV